MRCESCTYIDRDLAYRVQHGVEKLGSATNHLSALAERAYRTFYTCEGRMERVLIDGAVLDAAEAAVRAVLAEVKAARDEIELAMSRCSCETQRATTGGDH